MVTSPAWLVVVIPHLVGFNPVGSLGLVWISRDRGVARCTIRMDLETPVAEVQRLVHRVVVQQGAIRRAVVAYPCA